LTAADAIVALIEATGCWQEVLAKMEHRDTLDPATTRPGKEGVCNGEDCGCSDHTSTEGAGGSYSEEEVDRAWSRLLTKMQPRQP